MADMVVMGGGGHAKVLIGVLKKVGWHVFGYTDRSDEGRILGTPWLGTDEVLADVIARHPDCSALVGIGKVDARPLRAAAQGALKRLGFALPVVVSPTAVVNEEVLLGAGTMVFDGAVVNSGAVTGEGCILNTGCIVEHDCRAGRQRAHRPRRHSQRRLAGGRPQHGRSGGHSDPWRSHLRRLPGGRRLRGDAGPRRARRLRRRPRPEDPMTPGTRLAVIPARGGSKADPRQEPRRLARPAAARLHGRAPPSTAASLRAWWSAPTVRRSQTAAVSLGAEVPFLRGTQPLR